MARTVLHLYQNNPHVFHVLIDTTLSLAAVAWAFLALPALDLLLGDDPRNLTRVFPNRSPFVLFQGLFCCVFV